MSEDTSRMGSRNDAGGDKGFGRDKDAPEGGRSKGRRRRKVSFLTINKIDTVDYKEINTLRRFLNDRGKILPSRQTGNTAKQQRMITDAINRAREMALLPFVVNEAGPERREFGGRGRRDYGDRGGYHREDRDGGGYRGGGDRGGERPVPRAEAAPATEAPAAEAAPAAAE